MGQKGERQPLELQSCSRKIQLKGEGHRTSEGAECCQAGEGVSAGIRNSIRNRKTGLHNTKSMAGDLKKIEIKCRKSKYTKQKSSCFVYNSLDYIRFPIFLDTRKYVL